MTTGNFREAQEFLDKMNKGSRVGKGNFTPNLQCH